MNVTLFAICLLASAANCQLSSSEANKMIAYQPDTVGVGRMFMVALKVPPATAPIEVTAPECVEMFDRTKLSAKSELRKYYFRALEPAKQADIVFAHPSGEIAVSIEIWSFDDLREFRELKNVQLPRRWPLGEALPELKEAQTITTEKQKAAARRAGKASTKWIDLADEQIWSLQPDSTIPRWHWVNIQRGCPVHGTEVYKGRAFYPWLNEEGNPIRSYGDPTTVPYLWKMVCPVGKEQYPSNDFANGDMTSGEFPDDGFGGACEHEGDKYGFIAEMCQSYCHKMLNVAPECANGYLATGDVRYVHTALVALSRLAVEWAYLATMTQHRHRNSRGQVDRLGPAPFSEGPCLRGSGFTVYCIDLPGYQARHGEAYDKVFPAIDQDEKIIPFLQSKGLDVKTHEDVRRFIEENLFAVWMQGAMDLATLSNEPYHQWGLAKMAESLNYKRGDEFMDWLYDGAGGMRHFVVNDYFRDGSPYESSGGYNGMHVTAMGPIVESVEHLRELRPEVYRDEKYPNFSTMRRYHSIFDFSMNTVNIDRTYPRVGDDGGHPRYSKPGKRTWQNGGAGAFEHAYKVFEDPKFAWALVNTPGWKPSLEFPYTREQVEADAAKWPDDWNDRSRLQDGYGLAMLRSGEGDNKRALWMMYGRARGHTHDDMLHIGLDARQSEILGHLGYPRNWNHWTKNWITQILAKQVPFESMTATCQLFADAGPVHVCEALAHKFGDKVAGGEGYQVFDDYWQRRMLALIDVSEDQFYCLNLHRIFGGAEHWWTFHCQEGDFATEGIELTKQEGGTLAGPDVPYGDDAWLRAKGSRRGNYGWSGPWFGFPHLYNVERGKSEGVWSADWVLKDAGGLHFRLTIPSTTASEVAICDGKSPAGASPYEMKWVLMHNEAEAPASTQIASAMELYRSEPVIRQIRPIRPDGQDESGFPPYGLVVELTNGRTDTIFASADASVVRRAEGGFEFAGRFGLVSEQEDKPTQFVLVAGTKLTKNGLGITTDSAEHRATITEVDRDESSITLSAAPPNPESLVGSYVFITNPHRRLAQKVLKVEDANDAVKLFLEFDARVGAGQVSGHDDHVVKTSTPFRLRGLRYYHGARVANAEGTVEYRINGVNGGAFIDPQEHAEAPADTLAEEFPTGTWFDVYDYGVGDEVVFPSVASVTLSP